MAPAAVAFESVEVSDEEASQIRNKLRQIALAMVNYNEVHRGFPKGVGESGLSWRVHLLPFLDYGTLYEKFDLEEPWNSPANAKLLPLMPEVYRSLDAAAPGTHFVTFSGPGTMFPPKESLGYQKVRDGVSHTVLALHAAGTAPWTKPEDLTFDPSEPLRGLMAINGRIEMVGVDGGALAPSADIDGATVAALVTPRGGEVVDGPGLHRRANPLGAEAASGGRGPSTEQAMHQTMNRMKQVGLASHNYHDLMSRFPFPWTRKGRTEGGLAPAVSWRVALLPYLDHGPLYDKYDQQAEWDAEPNLQWLDNMPEFYRHQGDLNPSETRVHVLVDNGAAMTSQEVDGRPVSIRLNQEKYSISNTVLFVEAGPETASPWSQPTAIRHSPETPLGALGTLPPTGFPATMMDGSVRWLTPDMDPAVFRAMVEGKPAE